MPETTSAVPAGPGDPGSANPGDKAATTSGDKVAPGDKVVCSFCLKPAGAVQKMIAGPGVYICNECVELCVQILASEGEKEPIPPSWEQRLSDDDLLAMLPKIAATGVQTDRQLDKFVRHARSRGLTWTRIGMALGTTRQSAWERFSGEE